MCHRIWTHLCFLFFEGKHPQNSDSCVQCLHWSAVSAFLRSVFVIGIVNLSIPVFIWHIELLKINCFWFFSLFSFHPELLNAAHLWLFKIPGWAIHLSPALLVNPALLLPSYLENLEKMSNKNWRLVKINENCQRVNSQETKNKLIYGHDGWELPKQRLNWFGHLCTDAFAHALPHMGQPQEGHL